MSQHWYRIEIVAGPETYCYFGCTTHAEADLMQALSEGKFVTLEELTYYDEHGDAHSWSEWDPNCVARINLNPRFVVSVIPLVDHPRKRKSDAGASSLLTYPGTPRSEEPE